MEGRIISIGEVTYDILFKDNTPFDSTVGGSTLNTSISLGRIGLPVTFVSALGSDKVAEIAIDFIRKNGIHTEHLLRHPGNSRVALAFLNDSNDASYSFFPALHATTPKYPLPKANDYILFGSSFAQKATGREELADFLSQAKSCGALIIYDPNIRKPDLPTDILNRIEENFKLASVVKGSDEDFRMLFQINTGEEAYQEVKKFGPSVLFYTKGAGGAEVHTPQCKLELPAEPIRPVSTIGAGDNFSAGIIYAMQRFRIVRSSLDQVLPEIWEKILKLGIIFSAKVCMSHDNYISSAYAKSLNSNNSSQ